MTFDTGIAVHSRQIEYRRRQEKLIDSSIYLNGTVARPSVQCESAFVHA
jgi:hypothetical protein